MRKPVITLGDRFAVFEVDENFEECLREGEICAVGDTHVDVDFGDTIRRYPRSCIREGHYFYMRFLVAFENSGVIIRDFTITALAA